MIAVIGDSANAGSVALHRRFGFEPVGVLKAVGFKFGRWVDVPLLQRPLGAGDCQRRPRVMAPLFLHDSDDRPDCRQFVVAVELGRVERGHGAVEEKGVAATSPSRNRRAKELKVTGLSAMAKTTEPSSRTPTPLRIFSDVPSGRMRGWIWPSMTSIGPDWVAYRADGGLARKRPVSVTPATPSPIQKTPFGFMWKLPPPFRVFALRNSAPVFDEEADGR